MPRFLFAGDLHLRGTNPRNRLDDYKEASKHKLIEIFSIAKHKKVDAIILPGDVWNRPEVSIAVLLEFVELFKTSPVDILVTPGNHDLYGYNLSSFERSSLKLLELLVPQLQVITDPRDVKIYGNVLVSFQPYCSDVDQEGYGYSIDDDIYEKYLEHFMIKVTHGYLMQKAPVWDTYTLIEDCKTNADLILNGHDHKGHGVFKRADGKVFCNPGAVMRMDATTQNMQRDINVVVFNIDKDEHLTHEVIKLTSAKPGDEVLDRSHIEAENLRREAMDNFKMLIEAKSGERAIIDINQVIQEIAKTEGIAPEVVAIAMEKIEVEMEALK